MKNKSNARVRRVERGYGPRHAANAKEGDLTQVDTDTVPAMLTPREAVLNRNAAEMAGRGNIEALNERGNELAKRGVDLAAKGDNDVDTTKREAVEVGTQGGDEIRRLLGPWFDEFMRYQQAMRRGELGTETPLPLGAGFERRLQGEGGNEMARFLHEKEMERASGSFQGGTSDMKSRQKLQGGDDAVKRNPFPGRGAGGVYPGGAISGQPGGDGLQPYGDGPFPGRPPGGVYGGLGGPFVGGGGGPVAGVPSTQMPGFGGGLGARDEFGRQFSQRNAAGAFGAGHGVPPYGSVAPPGTQRPPTPNPWGAGPFNEPPRGGGGDPRYQAPPGQHPWPMPVQPAVPPQHWSQMPSQPFYPPGQGLKMAQGEEDILGNSGSIYGSAAPVQLSSPGGLGDLVKAITAEAQKQGLSPSQVQGILKMVQGMGGGGGSGLTVGAGTGNMDAVGAFAGGISDIGYPPFVAPNADYHADKGGWQGPYDRNYFIPNYG